MSVGMFLLGVCFLAAVLVPTDAACPHEEDGLQPFTDASAHNENSVWNVTTPVLLNTSLNVGFINVMDSGKLVLKPGKDYSIQTKGILVTDNAAFIIGGSSDECRFQDNVEILLKGQRSATSSTHAGEKGIFVEKNGKLNMFGKKKLSWTRLAQTVDRYDSVPLSTAEYVHTNSSDFSTKDGHQGLTLHVFNSTLHRVKYEAFDLYNPVNPSREQIQVNKMIEALNELETGDVVGINVQNGWNWTKTQTNLTSLFMKIEDVSGFAPNTLALREAHVLDAFSMVFVNEINGPRCQDIDELIGKERTRSECYIVHNNMKISAISEMQDGKNSKSHVDFRILSLSKGFPYIYVKDDISSWQLGDSILLTTTDYQPDHGEVRKIRSIDTTSNSIQLDGELTYRHVSVLENEVSMATEVALLDRNIRIRGELFRGCPQNNGNCDKVAYDTFGGHMKFVHSFDEIQIDGVSLRDMGQMSVKGSYPLHFHMCGDVTDKTAIISNVSIWNSYARAVTVHGTRGTDELHPGVEIIRVVAYQIRGHAFFLEDGAEIATTIKGCVGAYIIGADNGFATDLSKPAVYWITNPKVSIIGCVAAGSEGFGFWYVFPDSPVGPSADQNVFVHKEARNTPLYTFDNNVAHSNLRGGFNFDNILEDEDGNVGGCMNYKALSNPLDPDSAWVWNYLTRFTAYKNLAINVWIRGGWFILLQYSGAESRRCLQLARGSNQQPEVRNSVCIGRSEHNHESDDYPDAVKGSTIDHYLGVVFYDGPIHLSNMFFDGYENDPYGNYVAGAFGFKLNNKFSSSAASSVKNVKFAYIDSYQENRNRVFDGNVDDEVFGFGVRSGDEAATFRDEDGSVSKCPGETFDGVMSIVKPEKFTLTSRCMYRSNWKMARCKDLYGKIRAIPRSVFSPASLSDFDHAGIMKRVEYGNPENTAYENHDEDGIQSEFTVILGSDAFYYEFEYSKTTFPKYLRIEGRGIERSKPIVVGVCLPVNAARSNIALSATSTQGLSYSDSAMKEVTSLDDVKNSEYMNKYFINGRMLYFKLMTNVPRKEGFFAHDTDHCSTGTCPMFNVEMTAEFPYTPCFTPTEAELSTDVYLQGITNMTCELPASTQTPSELGWGAGVQFDDVDGGFGEWSPWEDCCIKDGETKSTRRERLCDNPIPYGDGQACNTNDAVETKSCTTPCPVEAKVSNWQEWSDCYCNAEATGSSGAQKRVRNLVAAENFGEFLSTTLEEFRKCIGGCQYATP